MAFYLVTGGAGFIGSNLSHALVSRGERVRIVDNFATGRRQNIVRLVASGKVELLEGDLTAAGVAERACQGVDYVLHQAAIPSVPRSVDDPVTSDLANVHGTVLLLDAARRQSVKRVVFAASSSAYGERDPSEAKVETMAPSPLSPYAASKLACEYYLKAFYASYGLQTVGLRYFNVFGPRQDPKSQYAAAIPNFVTAALTGRPATVYGDGGQTRDFCFIDNVIEANLLACTAKDAPGEIINIACGASISLVEVIRLIGEIVGNRIPPNHDPPRRGDIRHSLADIGKATRILGYTGAISFEEGLRRTIAWYKESLD